MKSKSKKIKKDQISKKEPIKSNEIQDEIQTKIQDNESEISKKEIPFTFIVPKTYEELQELFENRSAKGKY